MKKILSVITSLVLVLNTLNAGAISDVLDHAMLNITKPGIMVEKDANGKTIATNIYSGGVSFSFNMDAPPPIFSASPPSIEAGCNGINLKGMFISLLGLDQLGSMLQNAGASLAWGVAIGLIYSLPGVASAFKMINQWAKDLQKLLGNACQSGIAIGQYLAKSAGIDKEKIDKKINAMIPDVVKCKQEGENCVVHALGLDKYFSKDGVFNYGGNYDELDTKDKKDAIASLLRGIFESDPSIGGKLLYSIFKKGKGPKIISALNGEYKTAGTNRSLYTSVFTLQLGDGSTTKNIGGKPVVSIGINKVASSFLSTSEQTRGKLALFSYILMYNYVGDVILSNTNKFVDNALSKYMEKPNDDALGSAALKILENIKTITPTPNLSGPGAARAATESGRALANFIIYGGAKRKTLSSPVFTIVQVEEEKSTKKSFTILASDENIVDTIDVSSYKGLKKSSFCTVMSKLYDNASTRYPECKNIENIPIAIEDIDWFVKVIQNSPNSARYRLADILIQYNAQMAGLATINAMFQNLDLMGGFGQKMFLNPNSSSLKDSNQKGSNPDYVNQAAQNEAAYMARASKVLEVAKNYIKNEDSGGINSYKEVRALFKLQQKENRARGMKNTLN